MATDHRREAATWGSTTLPIILIIAALIVGLAALLPLVQSSGVTSTAGNIRRLEQEREDWQARLQAQEVKVAELASLNRIDREARGGLKMVEPEEITYITVDAPPPEPQRLPSRFLPHEEEAHRAGTSLWEDIVGWLPLP